jgi:hypothetical protein
MTAARYAHGIRRELHVQVEGAKFFFSLLYHRHPRAALRAALREGQAASAIRIDIIHKCSHHLGSGAGVCVYE